MAKRSSGSSDLPGKARSGSAKKRAPLTAVKRAFPWGTVVGGTLLACALVGIVVYAALNQGAGFIDPVEAADEKFPGLSVSAPSDIERGHVPGSVDYPELPPVGGNHNNVPQQCAVYTEQIPTEHAVHSLEHGAVWVTYNPDLPQDQVAQLTEAVDGDPYGLLSPLPGQEESIMLTAWGRQLAVENAGEEAVEEFVNTYASGPQSPEQGAACAGNSSTGSAPADGAAPAPVAPPAASPVPSSQPTG